MMSSEEARKCYIENEKKIASLVDKWRKEGCLSTQEWLEFGRALALRDKLRGDIAKAEWNERTGNHAQGLHDLFAS